METLRITQNYHGGLSHHAHTTGVPKDYPIDNAGEDDGQSAVFAPVDMQVTAKVGIGNDQTNTVWLVSTKPVITPSGVSQVFMTLTHWNDNNPFMKKWNVGSVIPKGEIICGEGTDGAMDNHIHLVTGFGYSDNWTESTTGKWVMIGDSRPPEEVMYIDPNFTKKILNTGGLNWQNKPAEVIHVGTPVIRNDLVAQLQINGDIDGHYTINGDYAGKVNLGIYNIIDQVDNWYLIESNLWVTQNDNIQFLEYFPLGEIEESESLYTIGQSYQFHITSAREGRTYTVQYQFGTQSGTMIENGTNSFTWTLPKELYNEIPASLTGTLTVTCITYDTGIVRGETTKEIIVQCNPSDIEPDITLTVTTDEQTQQLTDSETSLIYGVTDLNYQLQAIPKYGATIQEYRMMLDKETVVEATGTLSKVKFEDNIGYCVVDSRKESEWRYLPLTVISYFEPHFTYEIKRKENDNSKIIIHYEGEFFHQKFGEKENAVNNEITVTLFYKEKGFDHYQGSAVFSPIVDGNQFSQDAIELTDTFDPNISYEFVIVVSDRVSEIDQRQIVKGEMEMNFDLIYPIGRGFIDYTDTDYTNYLGFTWEKTLIGQVPVGMDPSQVEFDTLGKSGGSKELQNHIHNYSGTTSESGYHQHSTGSQEMSVKINNATPSYTGLRPVGYSSSLYVLAVDGNGNHTHTFAGTTEATGTGNSQNMPPYQVVNFWKRIA